ncbi:MAG: SIS domain-containing protein [Anaerolineae bacterium]|nr:SIS domain-containing protein [Anaerolineae bacterium]
MSPMSPEDMIALAQATVRQEADGLHALIEQLSDPQISACFVDAARRLLACEGKVLTAGCGTSRHVAARLAHLLSCCGTPALYIHPSDAQHGLGGAVAGKDVLIAISKGGETVEINHLARIAKERGAALIALTEQPASTLGQLSDVVLRFQAPTGVDPYDMIATGSSLFNSLACDALCVVLLKLRGYTRDAFGQTHPGGAVGIRLATEGRR